MADPNWKAIIKKWDCGIDVQTATTEELNEYVESRAIAYEADQLCDTDLWEVFKVEFKAFTIAVFAKVSTKKLVQLRSCLQRGGVYVAPTIRYASDEQGTDAITTLRETIKEKVPHKWTEQDVLSVQDNLEKGLVFSRALAKGGLLSNLVIRYATNFQFPAVLQTDQTTNFLPVNIRPLPPLQQSTFWCYRHANRRYTNSRGL